MQIYPGYTIRKIEEELSYREVEEISKFWMKMRPNFVNLKILAEMVAGFLGVDIQSKAEEPDMQRAIEDFKLLGFL